MRIWGWGARSLFVVLVCAALSVGGCSSSGNRPAISAEPDDPWEDVNRGVFVFNQAFDKGLLRPVSYGYREVVPWPMRDRVRNFLDHLRSPVILANDLFQGEFERAELTFRRFFINTILGVGGLIDIATEAGIPPHDEDFGQTLAVWGAGDGPYLMLPFLGPSNVRDAGGFVVDLLIDPVRYYLVHEGPQYASWIRTGTDVVDRRSRTIQITDDLEKNAGDYYATVRSLYGQRRADQIRNGRGAPSAAPGTGTLNEPAFPGQEYVAK